MDLSNVKIVSDDEVELMVDLVYGPITSDTVMSDDEDVQFICTRKLSEDEVFFQVSDKWVAIWSFPPTEKAYFNGYIASTCKHPGITTDWVPINFPTACNKNNFCAVDFQRVPDIGYLQKYTGPRRQSCLTCKKKINRSKKNKDPPCACAYPTVIKRCEPILCQYCGGWGSVDCNACIMCLTNNF